MRSAKFAVATPATREASKIGLSPKFGHAERSEVGHTEKSKFGFGFGHGHRYGEVQQIIGARAHTGKSKLGHAETSGQENVPDRRIWFLIVSGLSAKTPVVHALLYMHAKNACKL